MWLGLIILFIAQFIGGAISPVFVKLGVREIPPITFTDLRFIIASIVFAPFFFTHSHRHLTRNEIIRISAFSIFFALNVMIFGIAIQFTTAIMSQVLYSTTPLFAAFLAYFILGERLTTTKIIGFFIALLGLAFLLSQSILKDGLQTFGTPLGNILGICAVFSWATYIVLSKKLTNVYSTKITTFFSFIVTAIMLLILVPFELTIRPLNISHITFIGYGSLIVVSLISSTLMFFLMQVGIKKTNATTTSFFQYLAPFFAATTAIPILGEKITPQLIIGGILILTGVFFATTYPLLKNRKTAVQ